MAPQRVFVVWKHPIFYEAVNLLLKHPQIEWAGATSDYATARDQIIKQPADVVLVELINDNLPVDFLSLLEFSWCTRVIALGLADNKLTLYHRKQSIVGKADELLDLLLLDNL